MQSKLTSKEEEYLPDFGSADLSNPFKVPENYFQLASQKIMMEVENLPLQTVKQEFTIYNYTKIAAILALFIMAGASIFLLNKTNSFNSYSISAISIDDIPMEDFESPMLEETYASLYLTAQKQEDILLDEELLLLENIDEKTLTEQL